MPLPVASLLNVASGLLGSAVSGATNATGSLPASPDSITAPVAVAAPDDKGVKAIIAFLSGAMSDDQRKKALDNYKADRGALDRPDWVAFFSVDGTIDYKSVLAFMFGAMTPAQVQASLGHYRSDRALLDNPDWTTFFQL